MADKFYINYSASASPIEELEAADSSQKSRIIHSSIDKTIGGGKEIDCGGTAGDVAYQSYATNTNTSAAPLSGTGYDFLMIKIAEAIDSDGDCDCIIEISGVVVSKLLKVGDVCLLRPPGIAGSVIEIYSTASKLCKIDILSGKEA